MSKFLAELIADAATAAIMAPKKVGEKVGEKPKPVAKGGMDPEALVALGVIFGFSIAAILAAVCN
jgi:hypothetical protein